MRNNLGIRHYILHTLFIIFLIGEFTQADAQKQSYIRPPVTNKWDKYVKQVKLDSTKKMIEIKSSMPSIQYDLRYATTNNFMNRIIYSKNTDITFLRLPAIQALKKIQSELNQQGLGLKVFDAYRPYSVTEKFWELVKDEKYVANPSKGSGHNRGIAVDLTIIKSATGEELNMGTGFDNFSDTAHQSFNNLPEEILQNRALLKSTMEKYGFKAFETEWWHYYLDNGNRFEILDIDFKKLKRAL
jgi:D-alanyl-D-alanine dipeptidase